MNKTAYATVHGRARRGVQMGFQMKTDTIAAAATAMSAAGIGIIRVSGEEAVTVVNKIYRTKSGKSNLDQALSHTIHYGYIIDENGEMLDEVMVSVMKGPKSYTMEDTVEINCHGGVLVMRRVLEAVLRSGARTAQPGEFTKRAFLNGRIDLSRAEAVIDLIQSKNEFALRNSVNQLKGSISDMVRGVREELIYEIAFIESALDDPEHISLEGYTERLEKKTEDILVRLKRMLEKSDYGKILKEGIRTVIVGKPNAGKSSLLNILTGEDTAIVTEVAGTTRDVIEETILFHGISLNIIDTAGIRSTEDVVERIGVEKAKKYAGDADLIVYMVDASLPLDESDYEIIRMTAGKKMIVLLNKTDLNTVVSEEDMLRVMEETADQDYTVSDRDFEISKKAVVKNRYMIRTSMKDGRGIDLFEKAVVEMFFHGELSLNDEVFLTNMRHKEAVEDAYQSMLQVKKSLEAHMPEDFYSIDLMSAYSSLGTIIGEEVGEDLVNEIFSRFCMGK